jgi:tetratricopeptide (TPR) repeat protein
MHRPQLPVETMHVRQFMPFASVALLVAVMRPGGSVAIGVSVLALAATLPWSAILDAARVRRGRAAQVSETSDADATFAHGWEHLQSEEVVDAERAFRLVLEQRPTDADALLYLGLALAGQGRHVDAIEPLRAAATARPLDAEAHARLGISLAEVGEIFLAVTALRDALRLRPGLRVAEEALESLIPSATALEEERTTPAHARLHRSAARRRAHRYTRRTTPGSSLELQAGA